MKCSNCGFISETDAKFCYKCGAVLNESATSNSTEKSSTTTPSFTNEDIPSPQQSFSATMNGMSHPLTTNFFSQQTVANTSPKSHNKLHNIVHTIMAICIVLLLLLINGNRMYINDMDEYADYFHEQYLEYEDYYYENENKGATEKTVDAIDSWLDYLE